MLWICRCVSESVWGQVDGSWRQEPLLVNYAGVRFRLRFKFSANLSYDVFIQIRSFSGALTSHAKAHSFSVLSYSYWGVCITNLNSKFIISI